MYIENMARSPHLQATMTQRKCHDARDFSFFHLWFDFCHHYLIVIGIAGCHSSFKNKEKRAWSKSPCTLGKFRNWLLTRLAFPSGCDWGIEFPSQEKWNVLRLPFSIHQDESESLDSICSLSSPTMLFPISLHCCSASVTVFSLCCLSHATLGNIPYIPSASITVTSSPVPASLCVSAPRANCALEHSLSCSFPWVHCICPLLAVWASCSMLSKSIPAAVRILSLDCLKL